MAIKGLTTRGDVTPRFRTLGKLRKGGEKTPKGYGPDLDHFRFTSSDNAIVAAFAAIYGDAPHAINVYLPYPTTEENFPTWKEAWTAGGLQHRCDGETCTIWLGADGKYHREAKPCPGGCDEVGRLEFIVPELIAAGFVGTVTMETHSLNDMIAITQVLLKTEEMSGGDLRRVQFTLRRVPEKISVPGWGENKGKRQRVEKWLVKIEPAVDWTQAQLALSRDPVNALPAPDDDYAEAEIIETLTIDDESQLAADIAHAGEVAANAAQIDDTPFSTPEAAIQWGVTSGAFSHGMHAKNAYNKLRDEAQPENAREMARLWRADVARRLVEKDGYPQKPE